MSREHDSGRSVRAELAEHLRALRELGVTEIRRPDPPRTAAPSSAAHPDPGASAAAIAAATVPRAAAATPPLPATGGAGTDGPREGLFSEGMDAPEGDPAALLEELRRDEIGDCVRCKLSGGRKTIVFGSGNPEARLMFVGEGPGADEDAQGLPFVGRAGQLLTKMIESMSVGGRRLTRDEVYIANIIKCRPPGNRDPEPEEIAACEGFLFAQIAIIQPRVVVALGAFAARTLLRSKAPISALRGRFHEYRGTRLMPTFHPAYILRNYTEQTRRTVYEDLKKAAAELDAAG